MDSLTVTLSQGKTFSHGKFRLSRYNRFLSIRCLYILYTHDHRYDGLAVFATANFEDVLGKEKDAIRPFFSTPVVSLANPAVSASPCLSRYLGLYWYKGSLLQSKTDPKSLANLLVETRMP